MPEHFNLYSRAGYDHVKAAALAELRHAVEQGEKDHWFNALQSIGSATKLVASALQSLLNREAWTDVEDEPPPRKAIIYGSFAGKNAYTQSVYENPPEQVSTKPTLDHTFGTLCPECSSPAVTVRREATLYAKATLYANSIGRNIHTSGVFAYCHNGHRWYAHA